MQNSNLEPELKSLLTKLNIEIETDTKEIEIRKKRIEKNEALRRAVRGSLMAQRPEAKTTGYGTKIEMIREAIGRISSSKFTQTDLENEIKRAYPEIETNRSRLRSALWTMADKKDGIEQVTQGNNRQPAEYEKITQITRLKRTIERSKD